MVKNDEHQLKTFDENCIFCSIVAGTAPSYTVWEDEHHQAFLSIFPNTPGVTVVIPKQHVGSYAFEQSDEVLSNLIVATKKVAQLLDAAFEDVGRCGMVFEGFGVNHLHAKLYPLHGTGDLENWQPIESQINRQFFETYPGYISSNDSEKARDTDLDLIQKKILSKKVNDNSQERKR